MIAFQEEWTAAEKPARCQEESTAESLTMTKLFVKDGKYVKQEAKLSLG